MSNPAGAPEGYRTNLQKTLAKWRKMEEQERHRGGCPVVGPEFRSALSGTGGLWLLLLIAIGITLSRPHVSAEPALRRRCLGVLGFAIAGQLAHFAEELATSFATRFPGMLGLAPWSRGLFVTFNLVWIGIWILSAFALHRGVVAALAPTWFLALALVANGIAHPLLALRAGGYFPGLFTSPLVLVLGVLLWQRLVALQRAPDPMSIPHSRGAP